MQRPGHGREIAGIEGRNGGDTQCFRYAARRRVAFADDDGRGIADSIHSPHGMETSFLAASQGEPFASVRVDILHRPDFPVHIMRWKAECSFPAGHAAGMNLNALGRVIRQGTVGCLHVAKLILYPFGCLAILLLQCRRMFLFSRLTGRLKFLAVFPRRQGAGTFPAHFFACTVILHVSRRASVKIADIETGFLSRFVISRLNTIRLAVHDGMFSLHDKIHGTHGLRELFPWIRRGHLLRLPARHPSGQFFHISFRPDIPADGNGIPFRSRFFGFPVFPVGDCQIYAAGIPRSAEILGLFSPGLTVLRQPCGKRLDAAPGRDIPLLALTIPASAELFCLAFLPVGNIQIHTFFHGLFLAFRHGCFRFRSLSLALHPRNPAAELFLGNCTFGVLILKLLKFLDFGIVIFLISVKTFVSIFQYLSIV